MMVDLLAQTTQPTGMKTWGPLEWTAFFTAAGVFIGGLVTGIIAIINAAKANTRANDANQTARDAHGAATDAKAQAAAAEGKAESNAQAIGRTNDRIALISPNTEALDKMINAAKEQKP